MFLLHMHEEEMEILMHCDLCVIFVCYVKVRWMWVGCRVLMIAYLHCLIVIVVALQLQ